MMFSIFLSAGVVFHTCMGFASVSKSAFQRQATSLNLFEGFSKANPFEESGPLGKGITVAKVQVALTSRDRFICKTIEREAKNVEDSQTALAELTNTVCLALLRNSDDWVGACSESKWFAGNDSGKAEQLCNQWSNKEASKFEKEFIPRSDDNTEPGGATTVIVSIVIEIQGDSTNFEGAGFSLAGTKDVVSSLASNCLVDEGYCVNAAEVFWCPSDRSEVLTSRDVIIDFPEIIDL